MELNEKLISELGNCKNIKEAAKVMANNGINISEEDLMKRFSSLGKQELTDDDLNNVTGGSDIINLLVKNLTVLGREKIEEVVKGLIK
ncbi:MAG: hypothetical protein Q4F12_03615 [Erysipelotrichaceae bacterium]|nr:hypothetical protein [Erysipelotrichaceae bacterium]